MRLTSAAAVVGLVAALFAGCDAGSSGTSGPADPSESAAASATASPTAGGSGGEPVRLTFQVAGDRGIVRAYRNVALAFEQDQPGVSVRVVTGGSGAAPDVFRADADQLPRLLADRAVQPLDGLLEDRGLQFGEDYQRGALTAFAADSSLQCMPSEMSPLVVYYNRDLVPRRSLRQSGYTFPRRDETWRFTDFEAAARAVAGLDGLGPVKGTYLSPDLDLLTAFIRSAGDDVVDDVVEPTTLTLSSDGGVEAVTAVAQLARDPAVTLTNADLARHDPVGWFTRGKLGFLIGDRGDLPRLRAAKGLDFAVATLPALSASRSVSDVEGLCLAADSHSADAAADFIAYAVGPRAARLLAASGQIVPARLEALTSLAFDQPGRMPLHNDAFRAGAERSDPLPSSTAWGQVSDVAETTLKGLYTGDLGLGLGDILPARLERLDRVSAPLFAQAASRARRPAQ